jgi:two-component system nitrogen regulation sensor histidine kinase NtrY
MKDKVFTPNFTTKSSGTGLGLAISANMIESFNGKIYFETNLGKGTDFFVSIPLMRLDDYFPTESRVSLD